MFDYTYTINLYKSRINTSNYLNIITESLNSVVSLDLLNYTIGYLIDDGDALLIDKFLLLCLNNLNTNIRFQPVFVKSRYQDILNHPISYNIYNKFVKIIQIIDKLITVRSESFYNYVLYKRFSNDHKLDLIFQAEQLSTIDYSIYRELLEEIYFFNHTDKEFVSHANKLDICINEKSIKGNFDCINTNFSIKELLISINSNPMYHHYESLKSFDFTTNTENEEIMISFIKSLLTKDIYSFKKVYTIFHVITPTKRLLFAYFAYLYLTYVKYTNKYVKDRILNIVSQTDFSGLMDMIIEFYMGYHPPLEDLETYFSPLCEFLEFSYTSYIHIIYPLLYNKYNIKIDKYDHYIKVHCVLNEIENSSNITDIALNYKEISLCLLYGFYNLKKFKLLIKNNITNILNTIRQEYINNNISTCIFDILRYITDVLEIKISNNVWEYFRALGCITCKDKCIELTKMNENDKLVKCSKNVYRVFTNLLGNLEDELDLIKSFLNKYETDTEFRKEILAIYDKLPTNILDITGYIPHEMNYVSRSKIVILNNPIDYFKENFVEDFKMTNYELYSEAMDVLFYNAPLKKEIKSVYVQDIRHTKNYHKFLENLNDYLGNHPVSNEFVIHDILKYTELFTSRILEFTVTNMLFHANKEEITNLFADILTDKINHRILKFILDANINCSLGIKAEILIEACKTVENYHYIIYLVENILSQSKEETLYDLLQDSYYKIKDYERVQGINSMFTRPSKSNLFYEYRIRKEKDNIDNDILEQFRVIEEDLSEWKNINTKDTIGRHFIMDCKMVEKDISNLRFVTRRRHISGGNKLLNLHELLYNGIRANLRNKENSTLSFNTKEKLVLDTEIAREFYLEVKRDLIAQLISDKKYEKSMDLIYSLLEMKEWSFYYDLAEVYLLMGNKSKAKECLKKILNIFSKDDPIYIKALVRYLELVNSKDLYAKNINYVKNISRIWYLYGKSTDSIEYFMNSLLIDGEYKYECVPRIFHILGELEDKKKLNKAYKITSPLIDRVHLKELLPPFFSQILCKINNKNITGFINKIVLSIMSDYKEVYWSSIYFIDDIQTDDLDIDNKIYLNKIKKMRDTLFSISKAREITYLKEDFPEISSCIGMHVPNKYPVVIKDIENEVLIYRSLQAPKRLCFLGDDGKKYYYLCKYKDDLRKDSRFTEVCRLINKLFINNMGSNNNTHSGYYIRTYEVIPCFYNFGLIEYIEGLTSLKTIVVQYYDNLSVVARKYANRKKVGIKDFPSVLTSFKPVMDMYIRNQVVDPYHWYNIRNNYVKTCGVINMVGWFMGLGDRHTENILLDSHTFDMVHVDLNCIFDKGKSCSVPELVPFRLTQNIIDGFGALGIHGTYTKACVSTLDLLQTNRSIIISNLLSFVYDPLHEWNKKESTGQKIVDILSSKIQNGDILSKIEELNDEAMDINNLCNMYIGWLSFI